MLRYFLCIFIQEQRERAMENKYLNYVNDVELQCNVIEIERFDENEEILMATEKEGDP